MMIKANLLIFLLGLIVSGCTSTRQAVNPPSEKASRDPRAVDYYLNGALYDFQEQYEKALLEYYQALLYDSTSSQILKAIGRDLIRTHRFESAREYLHRSLKYDPLDRETLYYLAEAYFNLKDYQNSAAYFEKLWELDPYNSSVERNLIYIYSYLGAADKLTNFYERMIETHGYEEETVSQLYSLLIKARKLEEARQLVNELIQSHPNESMNWVLLGDLSETIHDTTRAIEAYQKALILDPDDGEALIQLYQLLRAQNDWEQLAAVLEKVVEDNPANTEARLFLAEALFVLKKYEKSQQTLAPLLEKDVHQIHVYRLMGLIASEQDHFDEAEGFFKKITQLEPKNKFGWLSLAFLYNRQQQYNKTILTLQDALSHLPRDVDLLGVYGSTLNQLGRYEEAIKILEQAYRLDSTDLNTIVSLGVAYQELKLYAKSDSIHEAALEQYPDEALLLNNYSYSLSERGIHLERALEMAKKAVDREPENGAYLDTMGWIYYKMGDYEKAKEYIQRAVANREDSPVVLEHLGDVYYQLGDLGKAREYWNQALEKDPDNEGLRQKIRDNEI